MLAGASMGAHTIARLALSQPERVAAAALITPAHDPDATGDAGSLARWDALAAGLREGGVEGFIAAYGVPDVPEAWQETVVTVLRQRLSAHEHPDAVADALETVPRSHPFEAWEDLAAIDAPAVVVGSRDEADPGHPLAVAERWAAELPGARLRGRGAGEVAAGLAGRPALEGHRRACLRGRPDGTIGLMAAGYSGTPLAEEARDQGGRDASPSWRRRPASTTRSRRCPTGWT